MILVTFGTIALTAWLAVEVAAWMGALGRLRRPFGVKRDNGALSEGRMPPVMGVRTLGGALVPIGVARQKPLLILFLNRGCPYCNELAPALRSVRRHWQRDVDILVAVQGDRGEVVGWLAKLGLSGIDATSESVLWDALGVNLSPFAVLLDPEGAVELQGIVNTLDQLEYVVDRDAPSRIVDLRLGSREAKPVAVKQ